MKKLLLLSTLLSLSTFAKTEVINIATEGAFAPFNFYKGKELTGFEVELGNALAKEMGLKVEWKTTPFDSLLISKTSAAIGFVTILNKTRIKINNVVIAKEIIPAINLLLFSMVVASIVNRI